MSRDTAVYLARMARNLLVGTVVVAADKLLGERDDHDKPVHGTGPWCPTCGKALR
jgi:hypothetical protein